MKAHELTIELLVQAYASGYFPMPDESGVEILWYRPDPRAMFELDGFHVSRKLQKKIDRAAYSIQFSTAFEQVMRACANRKETWITEEFISIYTQLHKMGFAHSAEIYSESGLVGGTYGVCVGGAFFAESMFHEETDCSKLALYHLMERLRFRGFDFLECQFMTPHLASLGAREITDAEYVSRLSVSVAKPVHFLEEAAFV